MSGLKRITLLTFLGLLCFGVGSASAAPTSSSTSQATKPAKKPNKDKDDDDKPKKPKKDKDDDDRRQPVRRAVPVVENLLDKGAIGIKAGALFSTFSSDHDPEPDYSSLTGFQGGASYDKAFQGPLGYRGELLYSQGGTTIDGTDGAKDTEITLSYVKIPVMLTIRQQVSSKATIYGGIGPFLGMLMDAKAEVGGKKVTKLGDKNVKDSFAAMDYGLEVGVGGFFPLTRSMMASAELRYSYGFADIEDHDTTGSSEDEPITSGAFLLNVGIHFGSAGLGE